MGDLGDLCWILLVLDVRCLVFGLVFCCLDLVFGVDMFGDFFL